MDLRHPAAVLRRLGGWLRPGGRVVFEESDLTMAPGRRAALPAHDEAMRWLKAMLAAENASSSMGFDLPRTYVEAGFHFERVRAEAVIQGQGIQYPLSALLGMMASRVVDAGIATSAEVTALVERLEAESADPTNLYVSDLSFCAVGRAPSASVGAP